MKEKLYIKADGVKHDNGKIDWSLLPIEGVEEIAKVLTFGAKKYDRFNWAKVPDPMMRYYAAAMRHMAAWRKGFKRDKQSGCSHLAHAGCCLLFLMHFDQQLRKDQLWEKRHGKLNNLKSVPIAGERRRTTRKTVPGVKVTVLSRSVKN